MSEPQGWDRFGSLQEVSVRERRDPLCVVTLVLGCLPVVGLAALPLGFVALKRTRRDLSEGGRLAIIGMGIAFVWAFALMVFLVAKSSGPSRSKHGQLSSEQQVDISDLRVGDCPRQLPADKDSDDGVDVLPCSKPHLGEVFARLRYTDTDYPGTETLEAEGDQKCESALSSYVGGDSDDAVSYYYPSAVSWDQRDRALICILSDPNGATLTGSARDSRATAS